MGMGPVQPSELPIRDSRNAIIVRICIVLIMVTVGAATFFLMPAVIDFLTTISKGYNRGNVGYLVLWFLAFCINGSPLSIASFPVALTAGFLYHWWAFPLGYCGMILGAHLSLRIVRSLVGSGRVSISAVRETFGSNSAKIVAFEEALKEHGFQMVTLLQLSMFPFGILNGLLGLTDVKLKEHFLATMLTRTKLALYIWIGMSAPDIAILLRGLRSGSLDLHSPRMLLFILVSVFTLLAFIMICIHVRRKLRQFQEVQGSALYSSDVVAELPPA